MKQRIISALFGLVILFAVFSLFETIVLNAVVAAIIVLALHELFTAAGERHTSISYLAMGFGATIPFFKTWMLERALPAVCFLFAFVLYGIFCPGTQIHKQEFFFAVAQYSAVILPALFVLIQNPECDADIRGDKKLTGKNDNGFDLIILNQLFSDLKRIAVT